MDTGLFLVEGSFNGVCFRCKEPSTGSFKADESDMLKMKCVNCGFRMEYELKTHDNRFEFPVIFEG